MTLRELIAEIKKIKFSRTTSFKRIFYQFSCVIFVCIVGLNKSFVSVSIW